MGWAAWFAQDLDDDDDDEDEDFQSTLHACSTVFVVINMNQ